MALVLLAGRKGILKTQSGVQIAYLSGVEKSEAPEVSFIEIAPYSAFNSCHNRSISKYTLSVKFI